MMHQRMRNMVIKQLGLAPKGQGVELTLTKVEDGEFDPTTGTIPQTTTEYIGTGVRVKYSEYTHRNFDIPYSDYQIYLSPIQLTALGDPIVEMPTPNIDDTIEFLGHLVKIIEVKPFNENGYGCGWKLRVRTS